MKNLVITERINATTANEVKNQVIAQLESWGYNVAKTEQAAQNFFLAEFGKEMSSEIAQQFQLDGELNGDWQTTITVVIKANYCDAGSEDYVYTVEVTED